jgi:hypothetical protein
MFIKEKVFGIKMKLKNLKKLKKINTLLLKNLIESDFLLLNKISENSLRYFKVRSLTNSSLDLFQSIKTLKKFDSFF